jgi:fido (protein-threonine AMPylation protein)
MYDAADDPYTYENSTVLVNKLGLRDQGELNNFEAEITNARAGEPLPEGDRAGQPLDLEKLDSDAMLHAMIGSFDGDESELTAVISGLVS